MLHLLRYSPNLSKLIHYRGVYPRCIKKEVYKGNSVANVVFARIAGQIPCSGTVPVATELAWFLLFLQQVCRITNFLRLSWSYTGNFI